MIHKCAHCGKEVDLEPSEIQGMEDEYRDRLEEAFGEEARDEELVLLCKKCAIKYDIESLAQALREMGEDIELPTDEEGVTIEQGTVKQTVH